ncbi:MAG TPA: hypothetical protein VJM76_00520, partial [Gammaproteobacteria bacterium]|nr:hypothetical protein [Gammaproteobacteria bacterium]
MRYQDPKLRALLAGEYVLGTLHGAPRRRFERLLLEDARLRALMEDWQRRLDPLADQLAPVTPPARVWHKVREGLRGTSRHRRAGLWRRVEIWRPLALAASLLLLSVGLYNLLTPAITPTLGQVAVLSDSQAQAAWLVSLDARRGALTVKAVQARGLAPGKALELWAL